MRKRMMKMLVTVFVILSLLCSTSTSNSLKPSLSKSDLIVVRGDYYVKVNSLREANERLFNELEQLIIREDIVKNNTEVNKKPLSFLHLGGESTEEVSNGEFWFYAISASILILFSGLMSGLTVGYLSIDDLVLELKQTTGTEDEKRQAEKVLPILADRHWLLVTLLLMNAAAMETLPLVLNSITNAVTSVIISVVFVLLFGEIIPQAVCTGPDQIKIASSVSCLTKSLMWISCPISFPIALILDWVLGAHTKSRFQNTDLKALIELHTHNALNKYCKEDGGDIDSKKLGEDIGLNEEQANLMISAIEMNNKLVYQKMIPFDKVFMYDNKHAIYDMSDISGKGYSRVPIYEESKNNVIGILRIKELLGKSFNGQTLKEMGLSLRKPIIIHPHMNLLELLKEFRKGKSHIALITEKVERLQQKLGLNRRNSVIERKIELEENLQKKKSNIKSKSTEDIVILGIITLEDVIEEMINIQILDEDDYDEEKKVQQPRRRATVKPGIKSSTKLSLLLTKDIVKENESFKKLVLESADRRNNTHRGADKLKFLECEGIDLVTPLLVEK